MFKLLNISAKLAPVAGLTGATVSWCDWAHSLQAALLGLRSAGHTPGPEQNSTKAPEPAEISAADLKQSHTKPTQSSTCKKATGFWSWVWSPVCLGLRVRNPISSQKMKHFTGQARAAFLELHSQSCTAQPAPQPQIFSFPYLSGTRHLLSVGDLNKWTKPLLKQPVTRGISTDGECYVGQIHSNIKV